MIVDISQTYTRQLTNDNVLEVSVYRRKWTTKITMDVWTPKHDVAVSFNEKIHINYERFLPLKWATYLAKLSLNKQSQGVLGMNIDDISKYAK